MSDLFHEGVPFEFIERVFESMKGAPQHTFQVLTKRADRLVQLAPQLEWSPNIWMGVSVESEEYLGRIEKLALVPASVKFVSAEPLLGPLPSLSLDDVDWIIVGGESGPGARPMNEDWVCEIRDRAAEAAVPFFFKQWGGTQKKKAGRLLKEEEWNEMPEMAV